METKLSFTQAYLKGRPSIRPTVLTRLDPFGRGCAEGAALLGEGYCVVEPLDDRPEKDSEHDRAYDFNTALLQKLWPWMFHKEIQSCGSIRCKEKCVNAADAIEHLWDSHVCAPVGDPAHWSEERFVDWLRSVDPDERETPAPAEPELEEVFA